MGSNNDNEEGRCPTCNKKLYPGGLVEEGCSRVQCPQRRALSANLADGNANLLANGTYVKSSRNVGMPQFFTGDEDDGYPD